LLSVVLDRVEEPLRGLAEKLTPSSERANSRRSMLDRVGSVCLGTIDAPPTVIDDRDFAVVSSGFSSVRGARV